MREHPLICSDEVVRAILAGKQTQDRRPIKLKTEWGVPVRAGETMVVGNILGRFRAWPREEPGDLLYVREAWARIGDPPGEMHYRAAGNGEPDNAFVGEHGGWHPSIHMPKQIARTWLRVTRAWVERLQDIDEDGCRAEGCADWPAFADLWNGIYEGRGLGWAANPWVRCCEFTVASRTGRAGVEESTQ